MMSLYCMLDLVVTNLVQSQWDELLIHPAPYLDSISTQLETYLLVIVLTLWN